MEKDHAIFFTFFMALSSLMLSRTVGVVAAVDVFVLVVRIKNGNCRTEIVPAVACACSSDHSSASR